MSSSCPYLAAICRGVLPTLSQLSTWEPREDKHKINTVRVYTNKPTGYHFPKALKQKPKLTHKS